MSGEKIDTHNYPAAKETLTVTEGMVEAKSESRERLPVIGQPMKTRKVREARHANIPGADAIEPDQELDWQNLVFVRTSEHGPQGPRAILKTPYSDTKHRKNTNEVDPRTTLHFAVNHHVRASAGGWQRKEDLPFIIITPAQGLIDENGLPKNLGDVDTFWDNDLKLPDGTVILRTPDSQVAIPQEKIDKIHVIDKRVDMATEDDTADIIERLGFTPIKGGLHHSHTEGVSEAFNILAAKKGLESGAHQKDETNIFEARLSKLDTDQLLVALRVFLEQGAPNSNATELLRRKLGDILSADESVIKEFAIRNKMTFEKTDGLFKQAKDLIRMISEKNGIRQQPPKVQQS